MAWIRNEDLKGQEVLDEVMDGETLYIQVENPKGAVVLLDEDLRESKGG